MLSLEQEILEKIKPTEKEKEKIRKIVEKILLKIRKEGYEGVFVGSAARGTFISGDKDIDLFVFFPEKTSRKELEEKGILLGKKILRKYGPVVHYAEHPYVKAEVEGLEIEIVPCYKMTEKIISAVDRSPLHNEFVLKNLKEKEKNEVLLLKQFLKAMKAYGADQKTKGFSGYLCELLIINYGSFDNVLKVCEKWRKGEIIDLKKMRTNYEKFKAPLIVIDPVDAERNVSAALSEQVFERFIEKAKSFLKGPSEKFFFPEKKIIKFEKKLKGRKIIALLYPCPEIVEEITWSQLERLLNTLKNQLEVKGFEVEKSKHWTDEKSKCLILFELKKLNLPKLEKHVGPFLYQEKNCAEFKKKNKKWWIKGKRLYAWRKRKYWNAQTLLKDLLKQKEIIPSHFIKLKGKMLKEKELLKEKEFLQEYFEY